MFVVWRYYFDKELGSDYRFYSVRLAEYKLVVLHHSEPFGSRLKPEQLPSTFG